MPIKKDSPFSIKEAVGKIPGFKSLQDEGNTFWLGEPGEKIYLSLSHQKIRLLFFIVLISICLISARIFWLQVIQGKDYNLIAEGNRIRLQTIRAERGIIYDRFNFPLVANLPNFSLYFIPADLPEATTDKINLANRLAKPLAPLP